jgi:hypothetical protein
VPIRSFLCAFVIVAATILQAAAPPVLTEPLAGRQVFPPSNWWNQDVSRAPVYPQSAAVNNWIS